MIKTLFLVPIRDNDGVLFRRGNWDALENRLLARFGAFSRIPGVHGAWEWEGRTYRDRSRQYMVSLQSWCQLAEYLVIVEWARIAFGQVGECTSRSLGSPGIAGTRCMMLEARA